MDKSHHRRRLTPKRFRSARVLVGITAPMFISTPRRGEMPTAQEIGNNSIMRAAFFRQPGPAEAIEVGELPVPVPAPTDVLAAVKVAVINPVDTLIRSDRRLTLIPL